MSPWLPSRCCRGALRLRNRTGSRIRPRSSSTMSTSVWAGRARGQQSEPADALAAHRCARSADARDARNIDELQNSNEGLAKQQRDLYAELDRRIKALGLEQGGAAYTAGVRERAPPGRPVASSSAETGGRNDQAAYNRAFDALKAPTTTVPSRSSRSSCGIIRRARWLTMRSTGSARATT